MAPQERLCLPGELVEDFSVVLSSVHDLDFRIPRRTGMQGYLEPDSFIAWLGELAT